MKIACILITLDRNDLTIRTIKQNFYNAGMDADVFLVDNGSTELQPIIEAYPHFKKVHIYKQNKGIAAAINKGFELAKKYDAVVTLANDILMPQDWLKSMVEAIKEDTGIIGIHCVEGLPPMVDGVHPADPVFGNVLITAEAIKRVGKYNTGFDPYGMQDADYNYRVKMAGLKTFYLPGLKSEHIGHDVGNGTEYRKMKDEGLAKAGEVWQAAQKKYKESKNYYL